MLIASLPIAVVMERRMLRHRWADEAWSAIAVVADPGGMKLQQQDLSLRSTQQWHLINGLQLELHPDENDGYYENWIAPAPKVFVLWRMHGDRGLPVAASVSYVEGARMLDSGESADGVAMSPDIHGWLGDYLRHHYRPRSQAKGHSR